MVDRFFIHIYRTAGAVKRIVNRTECTAPVAAAVVRFRLNSNRDSGGEQCSDGCSGTADFEKVFGPPDEVRQTHAHCASVYRGAVSKSM